LRCDEWGADGTGYKFEGDRILSRDWSHCPAKPLQDRRLAVAVSAYRAGQFSPLANWPDNFPARLEKWIIAVDDTIKTKQAERAERG